MIWSDGEDESDSERGTLAIETARVSMSLGVSEVGSWESNRVKMSQEPDGVFSLQVGDHRLLLRPDDPTTLLPEVKALGMRSRLSPATAFPAEIVAPAPPPIPAPHYAGPAPVMVGSAKSPGVAAVLSALWPGLGQIYNGQIGLGILFIVLQIVNGLFTFILIGFFTGFAVWIWSMVNAHNGAVRYNQARGMIS